MLRELRASSAVTSGSSNTRWRRIATTSSQTLHPANSSPQKNPTKNNPPGAHTATATGIAISATMMRAGRGVHCNQGRRTLQLLADRPRAARCQRQHVRSANRADNANCGTHAVVDCIHIAVDRLTRRLPHVESDETVERKKDGTGRKIRAESPDESGPEALQYVSVLTFVDCARDLEQRLRGRRRPDWTCQ